MLIGRFRLANLLAAMILRLNSPRQRSEKKEMIIACFGKNEIRTRPFPIVAKLASV